MSKESEVADSEEKGKIITKEPNQDVIWKELSAQEVIDEIIDELTDSKDTPAQVNVSKY